MVKAMSRSLSGLPSPESQGHSSAFAVAGGCLPAWWLELLELVEEWERRAGSARNDEEWHKRRDSMLQREAHTRWAVYHSCAEELRRKLGSTNFRQPEDNPELTGPKGPV